MTRANDAFSLALQQQINLKVDAGPIETLYRLISVDF